MSKHKKLLFNLILLFVFLGISLFFTLTSNIINDNKQEELYTTNKIGIKGLPYGVELSDTIILEDDLYIYFDDRIVEKYNNDSRTNEESIERIQSFFNVLPENVNKFVSLIPMAITYEKVEPYNETSILAINTIYEELDMNTIDIHSVYKEKKEDYLFYRTDPRITSLGAYYIAKEFLDLKGIEIININEYREDRRAKLFGIYMLLEKSTLSATYEDTVVSYFLDGSTNKQLVTVRKDDEVLTYESPTIAISRRGVDVFVEGSISDSILYGDGNESSIIVIGDNSAKVVSTWLTPYYKHVIVINSAFYVKTRSEFFDLFNEYNVTDVLLVESISSIGDSSLNSKLSMMYE